MSRLILESNVIEALGGTDIAANWIQSYIMNRVCAWTNYNFKHHKKFKKGKDVVLDSSKGYTRISYTKLATDGSVKLSLRTVRMHVSKLVENGWLESIQDNYSYKYGNIYTYTDKFREVFNTEEEFNTFLNTYNMSDDYDEKNKTKKVAEKTNNEKTNSLIQSSKFADILQNVEEI